MQIKAPNATDKHVGSQVRARRTMLRMSQEKLADGLGLTFQQVQKYEKGANRIGASRLQQIARILKVRVSFLFNGLPEPQRQPQVSGDALSPTELYEFCASHEGLSMSKAFMRIPNPKLRRSIVALVEQIAADATSNRQPK
jgi:transcriptional regulator with XRE-family HTH domain